MSHLFEKADIHSAEFKRWFGNSAAVNPDGSPMVFYHGTGNMKDFEAFDPEYTGKGDDQSGSGFYFTSIASTASAYTGRKNIHTPKNGGEDSPGVMMVYLSLQNPIVLAPEESSIHVVDVSPKDAYNIIKHAPNLYDVNESPVGNWFDVWTAGKVEEYMIKGAASEYNNLLHIENDWFREDSGKFREMVRKVMGYDGVIQKFNDQNTICVAWFPEQIKSVNNIGTFNPNDKNILK